MFSMMLNENNQGSLPSNIDANYWQAYLFYLQTLLMKTTEMMYQQKNCQSESMEYKSLLPIQQEEEHLIKETMLSAQRSPTNSVSTANEIKSFHQIFSLYDLNRHDGDNNMMKPKSSLFRANEEEEGKKEELEYPIDDLFLQRKKKRNAKICTDCPHHFAKHYAKNMCSNCYHSRGRNKKPWKCQHGSKPHYALGLCQNCYQMHYTKNKKENVSASNSQDM